MKNMKKSMQTFSDGLPDRAMWLGDILRAKYRPHEFVSKKISEILSGAIPVPVSYDDGDQSPLKGLKDQFVRTLWSEGLDYNPDNPVLVYHSDWMRTIYRGDYEGFLEMIKNKNDEELQMMLAKRETLMNMSAVFHVIIGARKYGNSRGHMRILIKLISLGVNVNVKDFAGFTPLHHCVTIYGNEVTFKMAERLIRAGAKVDAKHRFGGTPLSEACMTTHYDAIELLLKHGADSFIKDNDGGCPNIYTKFNPRMQKLFMKYYKKNMKEEMKSPDYESQSKCNFCKKKDKSNKKCSGCYSVWYCGSNCQRQDWTSHKDACQKTRSLYKIGKYDGDSFVSTFTGMYGTQGPQSQNNKNLKKQHFVVKVQVPMELLPGWEHMHSFTSDDVLAIYNKDKSFNINLPKTDNGELYRQLSDKITSEGYRGLKGYFHVILEPGDKEANQFRINPENIFIEPW